MTKQELEKRKILLLKEKFKYNLEMNISKKEIEQLKNYVPIQKIIGFILMTDVRIDLKEKILIPRYESEEVVLFCDKLIKKNNFKKVLDLCCGSGYIGICLKKLNSKTKIIQSDIDINAIKNSFKNNKINKTNNKVVFSNLFSSNQLKTKFDLIVSNPPYLRKNEKKNISKDVLWYEPKIALFAKNKGLFYYEKIYNQAKYYLKKGGFLVFEINPLNEIWFKKRGFILIKDINNKNRIAYKKF